MDKFIEIIYKFCLLGGLLISHGPLKAAGEELPEAEVLNRLLSGEITAESIRTDESGGAARFQFFSQSPAEAIWDVIISCDDAFVFVKGLKLCEVLENDGTDALVRQVAKNSWLLPEQDFKFSTHREPFRRATFVRTEGSPKEMDGVWELLPYQGGVIVTHDIRIRPGFPVPRFLIRNVMKHNMPDMLRCIRALANGSLDEAQKVRDAQSCPGDSE